MKSLIGNITAIVLVCFTLNCKRENDNQNQSGTVKSKLKSAGIVEASNIFGINLLKEIEKNDSGKNIFISPFSALEAFSMAYNGASGTTKEEMANVLGFSSYSDSEVNNYNKSLTSALINADNKVIFQVANSIWYRQGFVVLQPFIDINQNYYDAEVTSLDFTNPDAVNTINNWVNSKTNGKIPTIISDIPQAAMMYIINAIYFKGTWKYAFDKSKTIQTDFFKEDGTTVQQQQMEMEAGINYYNSSELQAVELPYGSGVFNLLIILPQQRGKINDFISALTDIKLQNISDSLNNTKVIVKMPKFKIELTGILNSPLINMGMVSAFDPYGSADFSRIDGKRDLFISNVIHKTYIELDEEGTEAAAVTSIGIVTSCYPCSSDTTPYFIANRPFIFAITEQSTGAVLFIGTIMDPTVSEVDI